jgi:hypothetical protein
MRSTVFQHETCIPLKDHLDALQVERQKLADERDRRYAEVDIEREKALKIKEVADLTALQLAREIQQYKDEKANELRSQIERERGNYATRSDLTSLSEKLEAMIKPLNEFMAGAQGGTKVYTQIALIIGVAATIITLITKFL